LFYAIKGYIKRKRRMPIPSAPESKGKPNPEKGWKKWREISEDKRKTQRTSYFTIAPPVVIILILSEGHA